MYESRLLNVASPVFHYGILFVLLGHLVGLFVPMSWTDAVGVDEHTYRLFSLYGGTAAGVLTVAGILLLGAIVLGTVAKLSHATGDGYNYRETVDPWARSLFTLRPRTHLMEGVPVLYQVHAVIGMLLIAVVPYSQLVHMFSALVQYVFRPYVVYRTRDPRQLGPRPERRGWERLGS